MPAERNLGVAYLLCLLLGIIGAHKLYLRRPVMATIYLFTAGLFVIGWIVDLFTLGEQVNDCNDRIFEEFGDSDPLEDRIDELEEQVEVLQKKLRNRG